MNPMTEEEEDEVHYQLHMSERGIPLIWMVPPLAGEIILTVENYLKWYGLQLLHENGRIEEIPFPDEDWIKPGEIPFADHVPNPHVVQRFADKKGYLLDDQAFEMMVGRWELEVLDASCAKYGGDEIEEDEG